jgi:ABC-type enterochelin transport system ATPase subunit
LLVIIAQFSHLDEIGETLFDHKLYPRARSTCNAAGPRRNKSDRRSSQTNGDVTSATIHALKLSRTGAYRSREPACRHRIAIGALISFGRFPYLQVVLSFHYAE